MKTKNLILVIFLAFNFQFLTCYSQTWQWAHNIGSNDQDIGTSIISDKMGNLYVTGSYRGSPCYFQTDTIGRVDFSDFFLMKYDNAGNEVWIKHLAGNNSPTLDAGIAGISYDSINDYIYICGVWGGIAFVSKCDLAGNFLWTKQPVWSGGNSVAYGIAVDNNGDIYMSGENSSTTTFGSFVVGRGGFIAKYDPTGNCLWAQHKFRYLLPNAPSELKPNGIKIYNSTILVAGNGYNDTIVVDTITAITQGSHSSAIAAFDLNGNIKWLKLDATPNGYPGYDFSIDNKGNSYVGGMFAGTANFDTLVLTNPMQYDAFFAKYNINGKRQWIQQLHATGGAQCNNVCTNANGDTYFTGYFKGTANFGAYQITSASPTTQDMFAARYDSSGVCLGVQHFGWGLGLAIYSKDNSDFWVEGQCGSVTIGTYNFTGYGSTDIFVAKSDALTGITEKNFINSKNQLNIYTNPNKGICNITVPDDFVHEKNLVLRIYGNDGKLVQQVPVEMYQEKIIVNLETEATGVYNATMSNGKKTYTGKIVFE
jgi:hypothetical protein